MMDSTMTLRRQTGKGWQLDAAIPANMKDLAYGK